MFCVTTAAIVGLAPHSINTNDPEEKQANRIYFENWMDRFLDSRLGEVNQPTFRVVHSQLLASCRFQMRHGARNERAE